MKIIIYTFKSLPTVYVARQLIKGGNIEGIILQSPMSLAERMRFIKRRISRYGPAAVVDEILFKIYYAVFLKKCDEDLRKEYFPKDYFDAELGETGVPVYEIDSINSDEGRAILNRLRPDLVIMESREMIAEDILKIPPMGFIGCHPGIVPEYRGVYASFWAMLRGEPDKVGLSVYMADAGVDTGGIVSQRASQPKFDIRNFKVESERLMIEGVEDLRSAIEKARKGELKTYKKNPSPTRFFTHVGLSDYFKAISGRTTR